MGGWPYLLARAVHLCAVQSRVGTSDSEGMTWKLGPKRGRSAGSSGPISSPHPSVLNHVSTPPSGSSKNVFLKVPRERCHSLPGNFQELKSEAKGSLDLHQKIFGNSPGFSQHTDKKYLLRTYSLRCLSPHERDPHIFLSCLFDWNKRLLRACEVPPGFPTRTRVPLLSPKLCFLGSQGTCFYNFWTSAANAHSYK